MSTVPYHPGPAAGRPQPGAYPAPVAGVPQPSTGSTSRTLQAARMGLLALLLPGLALVGAVIAAAMTGQGTPPGTMMAIAAIAGAVATIATGGTVAHGARHWGAREPSSAAWSGGAARGPWGQPWSGSQQPWGQQTHPGSPGPGGPDGGHPGTGFGNASAPTDDSP